jgi:hypothetical protein
MAVNEVVHRFEAHFQTIFLAITLILIAVIAWHIHQVQGNLYTVQNRVGASCAQLRAIQAMTAALEKRLEQHDRRYSAIERTLAGQEAGQNSAGEALSDVPGLGRSGGGERVRGADVEPGQVIRGIQRPDATGDDPSGVGRTETGRTE